MARQRSYLRVAHGNGSAALVRVETSPLDELSAGMAAPPRPAQPVPNGPIPRRANGTFAGREAARLAQRRGQVAQAEKRRRLAEHPALVQGLGLRSVTAADFEPYLVDGKKFAEHECARLAAIVGAGTCGNAPSSMVQSAALQLAGSRFEFARGNVAAGSKLANDSRQNLLAAHELCAREAKARLEAERRERWKRHERESAEVQGNGETE